MILIVGKYKKSSALSFCLFLLNFSTILLILNTPAHALVTVHVTNNTDSDPGSLRDAINNNPDIIAFDNDYSISLLSPLPSLSTSTTFDLTSHNVIVTGGGISSLSNDLIFDNSDAGPEVFTIGAGAAFTNTSNVYVGNANSGSLSILNGGALNDAVGYIGEQSGSTGTVTVSGAGSSWTNTGDLYIGDNGTGTLNIDNGGVVNSDLSWIGHVAGSTGAVNVDGSGSNWIVHNNTNNADVLVGWDGSGTLNITNGGQVSDDYGDIAFLGASGVTVDGSGSSWTNRFDLTVGINDPGSLNVTHGGTVSDRNGYVGLGVASVSHVTVDGPGSVWTNSLSLKDGLSGTGTINITDGASVSSATGYIGFNASGIGTMTVDGSGSSWTNTGDAYVGYAGTGTLTISNGATVDINNGTGTVYLANSNFTSPVGTLNIGNGGSAGTLDAATVNGGGGTATVNFDHNQAAYNFTSTLTGSLSVNQNGPGTTVLFGVNTYTGATTINAGTLKAGNAQAFGTGNLINHATLDVGSTNTTISGVYTQNAGSTFKLTADSSSIYGKMTTAVAASLDPGSSVYVNLAGYVPNNATFKIIDTAGAGIGNVPGTITSSNPRINFSATNANGNLVLTASRTAHGFASLGTDSNSKTAGAVLDNVSNPTSDMTTVLNTLDGLSNGPFNSTLKTMMPIVDNGVQENSQASLTNFIGASLDRLQNINDSLDRVEKSLNHARSGDEAQLNGIWAKPYGSYLSQGKRQDILGYNAWNAGTAIGVDRRITDNITLGISGGYAYGKVNSDFNNSSTGITSAQSTLYAGYQNPNLNYFIDAAGSFAWNAYNGKRGINVGPIHRIADSKYNGQQYGAYVEGGYKFNVGDNIEITPLASLQWSQLSLDKYTETNANALDLMVNKQRYDILESGVGVGLSSQTVYYWGIFSPEVHVKWLYDYINDPVTVTSAFTGGGASFTSHGPRPEKNTADIGGKLSFNFINDVSLILECDTQLKSQFFGIYGSGTLNYKF